jgi:O-methyltransferase
MLKRMKAMTLGLLRRFDYQLMNAPPLVADGSGTHEEVHPWATYAPWKTDAAFIATYNAIREHTLVDRYRCWELWTLVAQSAKLARGAFLEVGVWRGGTGALIARKAALSGLQEPVYLCDTFTGVVKAGPKDTRYKGGEHSDTSRRIVEGLTRETLELDNVQILQGIFPDQTADQIPGNLRFRMCHIDVDVYESARDVLGWVWPRLEQGGIVVYDDYGFLGCEGVARLVDEQLAERDRFVLHNLNGHAVVIKTTGDRSP